MLPDRFWFTGPVPDEDLAAFYRWADVYVSLSEHEGFCVPLVEAMAADVPVARLRSRGRSRNVGRAGMLFEPKDLEVAAEMLGMLVYDLPVRHRVIEGQRRRLQDFSQLASNNGSGTLCGPLRRRRARCHDTVRSDRRTGERENSSPFPQFLLPDLEGWENVGIRGL